MDLDSKTNKLEMNLEKLFVNIQSIFDVNLNHSFDCSFCLKINHFSINLSFADNLHTQYTITFDIHKEASIYYINFGFALYFFNPPSY